MTVSVVAFGGGKGLYATLRALNFLKSSEYPEMEITAVVGVSDDGGSSGRLRLEYPIVPPGDLRMALAALCPYSSSSQGMQVEQLVQFRFHETQDSSLAGHVVGNVVLTALWEQGLSTVEGLAIFGRMLNAVGTVLPASETPTVIKALVRESSHSCNVDPVEVIGQVAVATTSGEVLRTFLEPPGVSACPEAIAAISEADALIFGPGSWFTSVTPHLLIPELKAAIETSNAIKILVLNLAPQLGETSNFDPTDYLNSWTQFAPEIGLDYLIADSQFVPDRDSFASRVEKTGARIIWESLAENKQTHDPQLLAKALGIVLQMNRGTTWQ